MSYRNFGLCAADLAELIRGEKNGGKPLFDTVRMAAIGSYEQLLKMMPDLRFTPAAVVVIGPGGYEEDYAARRFSPGIIIIDQARPSADARAAGLWELTDRVLALFEPEGRDSWREIEQVQYGATGYRPLALAGDYAAMLIELEATAPMYYSKQEE